MNCVETQRDQHPGTILIVDDDLEAMLFAQRVIAVACPRVCTKAVQSGEELICYLMGEHGFSDRVEFPYPILILLDLVMPVMHGFQVLAWLTAHPPHNAIPVVVLTGSGEVQTAQQAYGLGARSFLVKPLNASEFMDTMRMIGQCENWPQKPSPPGDRMPEQ